MARKRSYQPETVTKTEGAVYRLALNPMDRKVAILGPGEDPAPGFFAQRQRYSLAAAERLAAAARRMAGAA